ncbi:MAG: AzlC family ABC transporter permease [Eubacteriales bacterium]
MKDAFKAAIPVTIPVMLGYVSVGMAFGLLLQKSGYNYLWAILMSITIYAGSMQFVAVNILVSGIGFFEIAVMTFFVNIRHVFYGLSFIDKFKSMAKKKFYMIFSLTDETYSLLCSAEAPKDIDSNLFSFCIAFLNHMYWITGTFIGAIAGSLITFNTKGIDFALVALFVVIFIEQWFTYKIHTPVFLGISCTIISLLLFGPNNLILPSMILISGILIIFKNKLENVGGGLKDE